ncbi:MAG: hypothetical protein K2N54_07105, partial [Helicobacter sp.]|nr:hypothetical protein [Helicobacter sp.]
MCVALAYVNSPQRCVYVMPYGLEHRRCALWLGLSELVSNSREMFRFAQHDKILCVIASEQRERGNQQATNPNTFDCFARDDTTRERSKLFFFYIFADIRVSCHKNKEHTMNNINTAIPSWLQSTSTSSSQIRQLNAKEIEELAEYTKATSYEIPITKNRRFEDFMSGIMWNKKLPENGFYAPPGTISRVGETAKQSGTNSIFAILNDKEIWNDKANANTIKTAFGEMRVSLKLDGYYYDLDSLKELSFLDTFNDGFITKEDYFADKLILRGYDEDGNEIELNFLDVVGQFDLTELYNDKKTMLNSTQRSLDASNAWRAQQNGFPPLSAAYQNLQLSLYGNSSYRAEVSYQKHDTKNTIAFFESYADKNGWIDFKNDDVARRIFSSQSLQLAYRKVGADGTSRLEKISIG